MATYTIKEFEDLTGIKAHTIRAWESRYELLSPDRSANNVRIYQDEDLRLLLNVKTLTENGWKISEVAKLSKEDLQQEVEKTFENTPPDGDEYAPFIHGLILAMMSLDESEFDRLFNLAIFRFSLKTTMNEVIIPFLQRVGILWATWQAHPGQEHFASNIIRQKLLAAIDHLMQAHKRKETFILFLVEGEMHEISLLYANYLVRMEGFKIVYLGQSLPLEVTLDVIRTRKPNFLLTSTTIGPPGKVEEYLRELSNRLSGQPIFLIGNPKVTASIALPDNAVRVARPEDLADKLKDL